jgi:uncharacterized protein YbjT (DUF2867 family)
MKIVVIGGSGLIGREVVERLKGLGHDAVPASPSNGVDIITGRGLPEALAGADVVVDVSNSPSFEDKAVMAFFENSGRNITHAAKEAGVRHHVALSIAGVDRLPGSGYFRAKVAQEKLIEQSGIPYTIVRATQFFEFIGAIAESSFAGDAIRVSDAAFQPIAANDVAEAVARAAVGGARNGMIEIAGPDRTTLADAIQAYLSACGDTRKVVVDPAAPYFGAVLDNTSLVPAGTPQTGRIGLQAWLSANAKAA